MDRNIFRFHDGTSERGMDPVVILRALTSDPDVDLKADIALMKDGDMEAMGRVVSVARKALQVEPYIEVDGVAKGLLENEVIERLGQFTTYLDELQKKTSSSQTSTDTTESQPE